MIYCNHHGRYNLSIYNIYIAYIAWDLGMGIGKKQWAFYAIFPEIDEQQYDTNAGIGVVDGVRIPFSDKTTPTKTIRNSNQQS